MKRVSKYEPILHYNWGSGCEGWSLVEDDRLSIKHEKMSGFSNEILHYHQIASQFFYILKGEAEFEIDGCVLKLSEGEGIQIAAGEKHRIINPNDSDLEFILCSQPSAANDRFNCNELI